MGLKKLAFSLFSILLIIGLVGCGNESASDTNNNAADTESNDDPVKGGTLKVALGSEPDSLDWMYISATVTRDVAWNIFENLFALDKDFDVKPMVAESYEVSEDGTVYTIKVREGVKFHDGSTVTADDVVASIDRWRKVSSVGKITDEHIDKVTAVDERTLEVKLKKPYGAFMSDLAAPKSSLIVIPAEMAKAAGEQPLKPEQLIGTGPYQFEKWDRGQKIVLSRFDDYSAREEADWGGLTGKKTAYFDKIEFQIVKDPQVMLNGLKTGLYDYVQNVPADLSEIIEQSPNIEPVTYMNGYTIISMDKTEAPFNDLKVREALNHALDKKAIAQGAYGNEKFYNFDGALFTPEQGKLYSKEGTDQYLAYDKEKAKSLLEESSYDGQTLKLMFANDHLDYQKVAQIAKQQLEEVGFKVELVPYEWGTYLEKWMDPANWDLVVIGWSTRFSPSELGMLELNAARSGWYTSERWESLINQWGAATAADEKKEILAEMNQTVNDELPFTKIVNVTTLDGKSNTVKEESNWVGPRFWNVWKTK